MPDPLSVRVLTAFLSKKRLVALVKKDGVHAATVAYQHADPKDWALRLASAGFRGLGRPRPKRTLARGLRRKRGTLRGRLNDAHEFSRREPGTQLVDDVSAVLARSPRWRRLGEAERRTRAATVAGNMLAALLESYDPSTAIAAADRAGRQRAEQLEQVVVEFRDEYRAESDQRTTDRTSDRLAWLNEQLGGLPTSVGASITSAFQSDSENASELLRALTDADSTPGEMAVAWLTRPPAMLGTVASPRNAHLWVALAEVAAAYDQYAAASTGFECSARAGAGAGERLLALALWAAALGGVAERVDALLEDGDLRGSTQPAARAVVAWLALERGLKGDQAAGSDGPGSTRTDLRAAVADWRPQNSIERQVRTNVAVRLELTDAQAIAAEQFAAARRVLEAALAQEWVAQTALGLAEVLVQCAADGLSADRAADLNRGCALALEVRDERRRVRGDARVAVRIAARAAGLALNPRRVIEIGSARYGQAVGNEADYPDTARYVVHAVAQCAPEIAVEMERELSQGPEDFARLWAHAHLAVRPGRTPELPSEERIALCRRAVAAAQTPEQLLLAQHDLTAVGGTLEDQPGPADLQDPDAVQMWARAALNSGDAALAVSLLRLHRLKHPAVIPVLADAYMALGRSDAAIDVLLEAARRFDQDDFCVYAAHLAADSGDRAKAEEILDKVLREASPDWAHRAVALYTLGQMQGAREAWSEATASWEAALERDPRHETCRWMLTQCYAARAEFELAWQTITTDPAEPGARREPPAAPTALLARMLLMLTTHVANRLATLKLGIGLLERFGGDTEFRAAALAIMTTARRAPGAEAPADPGEAMLEDQLQAAMGQFTREHPDHPHVRALQVSPDATGQELLELLAQQCRVSQLEVYRVKLATFAVAQGLLPLGDLAGLLAVAYTELLVARRGDPITARGGEREHALCVADALHALGSDPIESALTAPGRTVANRLVSARPLPTEPVVIDTSALYALCALGEVRGLVTSALAEVRMVDDAYLDIVATDEGKSREQGMYVFVDFDTGAPGVIQTPEAVLDHQRALVVSMRAHAASLRREIAPTVSLPVLDEHPAGRGRPWLESVRLSASSGAVLWADDAAVLAVARHCNLRTFSTSALLEALHARHLLTKTQLEAATASLIRANVGDFPPDHARLERLYRQDEDGRDAAVAVVAKPAFWRDKAAEGTFINLLGHAKADSTRRVATLVGNAVLGIIRSNAPLRASYGVAVQLLARALLEPEMTGHVPAVLEAARAVVRQAPTPVPDPLEPAARCILHEEAEKHGHAHAALALQGLTALCSEEDKRTVRLAILRP